MLGLASFVMRGPVQAAIPAALFLVLALFLPPFAWLSGAVVGLVFLRQGGSGGLRVLVSAALLVALVVVGLGGSFIAGLQLVAVFWVPVVILSLTLRETVDLGKAFLIAGLCAMLIVLGLYLVMGQPELFWEKMILDQFPLEEFSRQMQIDADLLQTAIEQVSHMMSGAFVTIMMLGTLASLLLARYWQASLFNPGGFQTEFHELRLGALPAILAIGVSAMAALTGLPVFVNTAPIAIAVFFFQGLAVFHGLVKKRSMNKGWLIGIYLLLLFLFPHTMVLLGALGMADNWINIRERGSE